MAIPRDTVVSPPSVANSRHEVSAMDDRLATYLKTRRTIPASQLGEPGPDPATLREMLTIAARVPDHGKLAPWRFILFDRKAREKAIAGLIEIAERHAGREGAPIPGRQGERLCRCAARRRRRSPRRSPTIRRSRSGSSSFPPARVCLNLLHAAAAYGFSAQWLTGWYAYDEAAKAWLGLKAGRAGRRLLHIGTPTVPPTERDRPDLDEAHRRRGARRRSSRRSESTRAGPRQQPLGGLRDAGGRASCRRAR